MYNILYFFSFCEEIKIPVQRLVGQKKYEVFYELP